MSDSLTDAQKIIDRVLREHHFVTELQLDGTRLYHCGKCCGEKVCTSHSVEEYRAHIAAAVDEALGGLRREPSQVSGGHTVYRLVGGWTAEEES